MAYPHHDVHEHETTYVEERDGVSGVLIAIGAILLVALLVWLFAFSGVVFDRGGDNDAPDTQRVQVEEQTNTQTDNTQGGGTTEQAPSIAPS